MPVGRNRYREFSRGTARARPIHDRTEPPPIGSEVLRVARVLLSEWRTFLLFISALLLVFGDRTCATLRHAKAKGSHAQRTPLNMGALHRVTAGLAQYYRARTRGDAKERSHPHRLRTRTRGFAPLLSCSRTRGAEMAIWAVSGGSKQGECKREEAELQPKYRAGSSARSRGSRTQDASHQSLTRHLECCSGSTQPFAHR